MTGIVERGHDDDCSVGKGIELKPCPSCRGTASLVSRSLDERWGYAHEHTVRCLHCNLKLTVEDSQNPKGGYALQDGKVKAIAAWNTRTPDPEALIAEGELKPVAPPLSHVNDGGRSELIARIEYILDPAASASERSHRRMHLTNHDLRVILNTLLSLDPEALVREYMEKK